MDVGAPEVGLIAAAIHMLARPGPDHRSRFHPYAVEALEEMGGLISPLILTRFEYQGAVRHGWSVTELNPYGAGAEEMRGLWQSVKRRLVRTKARQPARTVE
jgi:chromosome partitioning protein